MLLSSHIIIIYILLCSQFNIINLKIQITLVLYISQDIMSGNCYIKGWSWNQSIHIYCCFLIICAVSVTKIFHLIHCKISHQDNDHQFKLCKPQFLIKKIVNSPCEKLFCDDMLNNVERYETNVKSFLKFCSKRYQVTNYLT